ncbi:MAG TPA: hypothetical protein VF615_25530 [Longimicrobiaceae bacterium]|jgi:hypothetical protein
MPSGFAYHIATWDAPGTLDVATGAVEVYAEGYSAVDSTQQMCLQLLGPTTDNGFQGYTIGMGGGGAILGVSHATNAFSGSAGSVTSTSYTFPATPAGTRFPGGTASARWCRLIRLSAITGGVRIQVKQWHNGGAEPAGWLIDVNDTSASARTSGLIGVYGAYPHDDYLHFLGVGTAGDAAPRGANTAPSTPTVSAGSITRTSMVLSGGAFVDVDPGAVYAKVRWQFGVDPTCAVTLYDSGAGGEVPSSDPPTLPRTSLTPGQTFYFRRQDSDGIAWSNWSLIGSAATLPNTLPSPPILTSLVSGEVVDASAALDCTEVTDADGDPVTYAYRYRLVGAGSWTAVAGGWTATRPRTWDTSALAAGLYEVAPGASDPYGANWGDPVQTEVAHTAPSAEPPLTPTVAYFERLAGNCVRAHITDYASPAGVDQGARRVRIVDDGVVVLDYWDPASPTYVDYCLSDPAAPVAFAFADRDLTAHASALTNPAVPFSLATLYDDFAEHAPGTDLAAHPSYTIVPLSNSGLDGHTWTAVRAQGTRGARAAEGYFPTSVVAEGTSWFQGATALRMSDFGPSVRVAEVDVVVTHNRSAGEPGPFMGGLAVALTGEANASADGIGVGLSPTVMRVGYVGGGHAGAMAQQYEDVAITLQDGELYTLRLAFGMVAAPVIVIYPGLVFEVETWMLPQGIATLVHQRTGEEWSVAQTFCPGPSFFDPATPGAFVPTGGYCALLHWAHEGTTSFGEVRAGSAVPEPRELLPTPVLRLAYGTPVSDTLSVPIDQPGAFLDPTLEFEAEYSNGGSWQPLAGAQTLAPDPTTGTRLLEVGIAWAEGREYQVQVRSRRPGGEWSGWSVSQRIFVDHSSSITSTHFQPADFALQALWGSAASFLVGQVYGAVDWRALVHSDNANAGVQWVEGGLRSGGLVYLRGRLSVIQSALGPLLQGASSAGGSALALLLSQIDSTVQLVSRSASGDTVLSAAPVDLRMGPYYNATVQLREGSLQGRVWRDNDPDSTATVLRADVVASGPGALGIYSRGRISGGARQREVDFLGYTAACEPASVAAVEISTGSADLAVSPAL